MNTSKFITLSSIITENKEYKIEFESHSYHKESMFKKIESNILNEDEIENNLENKEIYSISHI